MNTATRANPVHSAWLFLGHVLVVWTATFGISAWWALTTQRGEILEVARVQALSEWRKDVLYRRWNAQHSPVYVPVTASTPPNPLLAQIPERDISTPSGRKLTLMNPAYMTRQVHEIGAVDGVYGHITSLTPIRPRNAPDDWERRALEKLRAGAKEVVSVETMSDEAHLRLLRPLVTEQSCLKCHAAQGYHEGDLRGGLSVAVPLGPLVAAAGPHRRGIIVGHLLLWGLGVGGFLMGTLSHLKQVRGRLAIEAQKLDLEQQLAEGRRLEAVGTLAGGIAHQFNNLLMIILGHSELARDEAVAAGRPKDNIDRILDAVARAAALVEKMSTLAHQEEVFSGEAEVKETLQRVLAPMREHLPAHTVVRDEVFKDASVAMEPSELQTLLRNLLSNAAGAIDGNGGEITVKATPCELPAETSTPRKQDGLVRRGVRIVVEDSGVGMSPEVVQRAFEPFFTTRDVGQGDGLGLAVARAIVERHGGRIEIQSTAGRGTCVEVFLEAAVAQGGA